MKKTFLLITLSAAVLSCVSKKEQFKDSSKSDTQLYFNGEIFNDAFRKARIC